MKKLICLGIVLGLTACATTTNNTNKNKPMLLASSAQINVQLGLAYLGKNQFENAKQKLLTAEQLAPNLPETAYALGYFYEVTGNKALANKFFNKSLALAPHRGDVQNNYGTYLCRSGNYHQAIQHFMLATQDQQYLETADAEENAGLCALKIPDEKLAAAHFEKAVLQDANRPVSLINLAELYYAAGNYVQAKKNLAQYLLIAQPSATSLKLSSELAKLSGNEKEATKDAALLQKTQTKKVKHSTLSSVNFSYIYA